MTERVALAEVDSIRVGRYAESEVDLIDAGLTAEPLELSLAAPFGALFSALFPARPFRVKSLALTYVAPERLGRMPTFSAKVSGLRDGGEAQLSLVVFRSAQVCVRGEAVVLLGVAPMSPSSRSAAGTNGAGQR